MSFADAKKEIESFAKLSYENLTNEAYKNFNNANFNKAKKYFLVMLDRQHVQAKNLSVETGTIYFALGRIAMVQKDPKAIGYLKKAKKAFEKSKDYSTKAHIKLGMWNFFFHQKEYQKALKYSQTAEALANRVKNVSNIELCVFKIAVARSLQESGKYKEAITHYRTVSATLKKYNKNKYFNSH